MRSLGRPTHLAVDEVGEVDDLDAYDEDGEDEPDEDDDDDEEDDESTEVRTSSRLFLVVLKQEEFLLELRFVTSQ